MTSLPPIIILVDPQMGENIGAAARAMGNCGLKDLRLVRPRDGWPNEKATAMSSGAFDHMNPVDVFEDVESAIADCHYVYATTARPRGMNKIVMTAEGAAQDMAAKAQNDQRSAILFGAERTGLVNEDVARANAQITIPLNPDFSSLNLGQSVLLLAYEWLKASGSVQAVQEDAPEAASQEELSHYLGRLEEALENSGFFKSPEMKPATLRNIISHITRSQPTKQELQTLQGILTALMKR